MRTAHLTCIALVVTLLLATTSLADTWVAAHATPSQPFEYDHDEGGFDVAIWDPGDYHFSYYLYAYARVYIRGTGDPSGSTAYADALAKVEGEANEQATAQASVSGDFVGDTVSDPKSGGGSFTVTQPRIVLTFDDEAWADATCGSNDPIQVYATASTTTSGNVWPAD